MPESIIVAASAADGARLEAVAADRNRPRKPLRRAPDLRPHRVRRFRLSNDPPTLPLRLEETSPANHPATTGFRHAARFHRCLERVRTPTVGLQAASCFDPRSRFSPLGEHDTTPFIATSV